MGYRDRFFVSSKIHSHPRHVFTVAGGESKRIRGTGNRSGYADKAMHSRIDVMLVPARLLSRD